MKIRLLSDLHMEGYKYCYTPCGEDVVVLAGDIHTRNRHEEIISQIPSTTRIVMVAGNHEYYRGEFNQVNEFLKKLESEYPNFTFLHNSRKSIDGVEFFGGTMYSDLYLYGQGQFWETHTETERCIADFRVSMILDKSGVLRQWQIEDHLAECEKFKQELAHWIRETEGKKRVVVSHFVPHPNAIHPRWGASALNGYFTVNMERFMGWDGLWLFGHTHDSTDFMIEGTRCISNPRGYGDENRYGFDEEKVIEI